MEVLCNYYGYGSVCEVPCDFDPSCRFDLHVTWSTCHVDLLSNRFENCVCTDGIAVCRSVDSPLAEPMPPTSYCELAPRSDAAPADGGP